MEKFKAGQKVFVEQYQGVGSEYIPYGKNGKFLREHPNGVTGAVELAKGLGPIGNGVVIVKLSDLSAETSTEAKIAYLNTGNGKSFVEMLRPFESTMYAKVRYPEKFFSRYQRTTGESISSSTSGILISTQKDKYGDEMSMRFTLGDFNPVFPKNAHPRLYKANGDELRGILNDNAYIWALIEHHGFRFGREDN
jgi:hypothetical protein